MLILLLFVLRKRNITSVMGIPLNKKVIVFLYSSMTIVTGLNYLVVAHPDLSGILKLIVH